MMNADNPITEGPVGRTLVNLTASMILDMLDMLAFNLVDTYFIGQLGTAQLAAISFTFPVIILVSSFAQGIGIGVVSLVSSAIGEGQFGRTARETTDIMLLAGYGPAAVAAYGIAARIEMLGTSTVNALSSVIGPFNGQNLGARKFGRISEGLRLS